MSWPSSSRPLTATTPNKRIYTQDGRRETHWSWNSRRVDPVALSSSPLGSSSPVHTPSSSRHSYAYAYIRSSPEIGPDSGLRGSSEHLEDPVSPWDRRHSSYGAIRPTASSYTAVSLKPTLPHPMDYPPSSDFEPSDYSEDFDHDPLDLDSEPSDGAPCPSSTPFSDSEEDESPIQENDDFDFDFSSCRRTFFRTSAERGQWESDPCALKPSPPPQTWPTAPTLSRVATPTIPASSRISIASLLQPEGSCPISLLSKPVQRPEPTASSSPSGPVAPELPPTSEPQVEVSSSPQTLPSLTSDRESSPDVDDDRASPLSPLPPSSQPLSPVSVALSYHSEHPVDIAYLSSPLSSPILRSSSPLSELSLDDEDQAMDHDEIEVTEDSDGFPQMDAVEHDAAPSTNSKSNITHLLEEGTRSRMTSPVSHSVQRKSENGTTATMAPSQGGKAAERSSSSLPSTSDHRSEGITGVTSGPCGARLSATIRDGHDLRPVKEIVGLGPSPAGLSTVASASKSIISHSPNETTPSTSHHPIATPIAITSPPLHVNCLGQSHQRQRDVVLCGLGETKAFKSDANGVPDRTTPKSRPRHEAGVTSASLKKLLVFDDAQDGDGPDGQRNLLLPHGSDACMEITAASTSTLDRREASHSHSHNHSDSRGSKSPCSLSHPFSAEDGDVVMVDGVDVCSSSPSVPTSASTSTSILLSTVTSSTSLSSSSSQQTLQLRDKNGVERSTTKKLSAETSEGAARGSSLINPGTATVTSTPAVASNAVTSKRKETSEASGAPVKKRRKVGTAASTTSTSSSSSVSPTDDAPAASSSSRSSVDKREDTENDSPEVQQKQRKPKKKQPKEKGTAAVAMADATLATESESASKASTSTSDDAVPAEQGSEETAGSAATTSSKPKKTTGGGRRGRRPAAPPVAEHDSDAEMDMSSSLDAPLDAATATLHAEVCGLLIETLALSRASSMPVSLIFKTLMRNHPTLEDQRSEKEWIGIVRRVLRDGEAGRGSGVFGKVESSGKDDADRPLEAHWFYVPELDTDQDRATLIKSMMPRPAKRSTTKKYKQYYWRPLDKISKWDPEDEL